MKKSLDEAQSLKLSKELQRRLSSHVCRTACQCGNTQKKCTTEALAANIKAKDLTNKLASITTGKAKLEEVIRKKDCDLTRLYDTSQYCQRDLDNAKADPKKITKELS